MLLPWAIEPGQRLAGRYRMSGRVGGGATAEVHLAEDERSGEHVAIKFLDELRVADDVADRRFERELAALARINHPGVARVRELVRADGVQALVMEHVPGPTLADRLERRRLTPDEVICVGRQLCAALGACHAAGVLHRDLKPDNLVLHPDRGVVVLDFGLAWFSSSATLTRTGAVLGSPQYLAPEAFRTSRVDARADLWSAAAILFELLTGRPVHLGADVAVLATQRDELVAPSAAALRPGVPRGLDRALRRALSRDPGERYATAAELGEALQSREGTGDSDAARSGRRCDSCGQGTSPTLDFCPGCGRDVRASWRPGRWAVELIEVPDAAAVSGWLAREFGDVLSDVTDPVGRLEEWPTPLIRGINEAGARRLAVEAEAAGATAKVVRHRPLLGPPFAAAPATFKETALFGGIHFMGVVIAATASRVFGGVAPELALAPVFGGAFLAVIAWCWGRRPLLASPGEGAGRARTIAERRVVRRLRRLRGGRARGLAAVAVRRGAELLTGRVDDAAGQEAFAAALVAAEEVDLHAAYMADRPRASLSEEEREEWTEVAVAHDLAARRALVAATAITEALSMRSRLEGSELGG